MKKLLIVLLLCGCSRAVPLTDSVVSNAKGTIDSIVSVKPECSEVGDVCKRELDSINSVCKQSIKNANNEGWNKGFKRGVFMTLMFVILAFLGLKRITK